MFLVRMIYCSKLQAIEGDAIGKILDCSRKNNAKHGLTGVLVFNNQYFLQCLEGGRSAVNATYHRILSDPRHVEPVLLSYGEISRREFADWEMGYVPWQGSYAGIVKTFAKDEAFNPYRMDSGSAIGLLIELRKKIPLAAAAVSHET